MSSCKCSVDNCKRDFDTLCAHCEGGFCTRHYIGHAKLANEELIPLVDRLNSIIQSVQQSDPFPQVLQNLEEWRQKSHEYIDRIYDEKQGQLRADINQKIEQQMNELRQLSQQVKELVGDGDVSFKQVEKIRKDIEQCQQQYDELNKQDFIDLNIKFVETERSSVIKEWFIGGSLLSMEQQIKLNEFYGKWNQKWQLIYKATRDGFGGTDFHRLCNNQGATITVIQSKNGGYLFGGYTSLSWHSAGGYSEDKNGPFLFTLTNPHQIPPTKYAVKLTQYSILGSSNSGPIFGGGDIFVRNKSQMGVSSYSDFPHSYVDTTGRGDKTFTGNKNFQTGEIEVYRLV